MRPAEAPRRPGLWRRLARVAFVLYLILFLVSSLVRWRDGEPAERPRLAAGQERVEVERMIGDGPTEGPPVGLAWRAWGQAGRASHLPVLLLHGSPGSGNDFRTLGPALGRDRLALAPDLPGFGASSPNVPDYSVRAHARYALELLDHLEIERAHLVGFSMGGGVALEIAGLAPERVASVSLLAAIGVQELELLGTYTLNHLVHGLQLGAIEGAALLVPHMGILDRFPLDRHYARNFFDTDQRPLRGILETLEAPTLIVHGVEDPLVPVAAAREHHRIVPQSELVLLDDSHFFVFSGGAEVAPTFSGFFDRVEAGDPLRRSDASAERLALAAQPFDPQGLPAAAGFGLVIAMALLALSTLVSEDLATIGAGLLAAQGRIPFWAGATACFVGIYVGDLLLFLVGRAVGRPALRVPPLKWWLREEAVERSSAWFDRKGLAVIALSRFTPGARLPTYFAAGLLRTSFWRFALYFFLAAAVWTPILAGLAMVFGATIVERVSWLHEHTWSLLLVVLAFALVLRLLIVPLFTHAGRRGLVGRWRRWRHWEFWPPWVFYPPLIVYLIGLAIRYRSATLFTASNPGIAHGGFIGESKAEILGSLADANRAVPDCLPRWELLGPGGEADGRAERVETFRRRHGVDYPLILKPNAGQRGTGVRVVRSAEDVRQVLAATRRPMLVQEYVEGVEFGVFYVRLPGEETGRIFSITEKRMPAVVGDGRRTLEELVLDDPRAVSLASLYLEGHGKDRDRILAAGERFQLVELGTHCRGAIFLDGGHLATPELTTAIDRVSRTFDGFFFGRYDLRAPSADALAAGGPFRIIELNGVTSEATHIYDRKTSLLTAYRTLAEQWRLAFEIGARNRDRGARVSTIGELFREAVAYRRALRRSQI